MNFTELEGRLVLHLRMRIRCGELTERSVARMTGVSQPHIHNVLKGKRTLSAKFADLVLRHLELDLMDLIEADEWLQWHRRL